MSIHLLCPKLGKHPLELRNLGILGVQAVSSPNARPPADFGTLGAGESGESMDPHPTRFFCSAQFGIFSKKKDVYIYIYINMYIYIY